jgi:dienelactone hydrolase
MGRFTACVWLPGICLLGVFLVATAPDATASRLCAAEGDDARVLPLQTDEGPTNRLLTRWLQRAALAALDRRQQVYELVKTPDQIAAYQTYLRSEFADRLGEFPDRTPLNAQVVGRIPASGYRIEKLILESQPAHYVTALLYVPEGQGPFPAVVVPSGHSATGKAADYNQLVCMLLARHGIAALAYDPIGQGERSQFLNEAGKPRYNSTTEHTLVGAGCIPLGRNTATFRIWDGMRMIDYLASRPDIDPQRIGATGCSGGGTLTSYLMALDDRVACAAPSCYITSFRRLIETIGPQDAEQNIFGQLDAGLDHADYLLLRAPRPTLILASTHDFFDIAGTWDSFRQAKRFYTRLGYPERVEMIELDARHGYPRPQREAMLRWMQRWLQQRDAAAVEPELEPRPVEDLLCTPQGQVMRLPGARSVADLNAELNERYAAQRRALWEVPDVGIGRVRQLTGIRTVDELPEVRHRVVATTQRSGYRLDKVALEVESGITLPGLLAVPEKRSGRVVLYLDGAGKHSALDEASEAQRRVRAGDVVLALDLRGLGETGSSTANLWGGDWKDYFLAYLLGKSLVAMRAEDTLASARWLGRQYGDAQGSGRVEVIARGVPGVPALHAVALQRDLFEGLTLVGTLESWSGLVRNPTAAGHLANTVHGALRVYDLPDLVQACGQKPSPVRVQVVDPVRADAAPPGSGGL